MMTHWLKQVFGGKEARSPRPRTAPAVRLGLECFEDRVVPSVQFAVGSETVLASAGTFNVAVTQTGPVTPTVTTFATGFTNPIGLAFDADGNLYAAAANGVDTVSKVGPGGGVATTFATGFTSPTGLAFDAAGNLYAANFNNNTVSKVSTAVTALFTLGGSAAAGTDYSGVTASPITFTSSQVNSGTASINITGTLVSNPGPDKTLTFTLGTPTGDTLGSPSVNTLTIDEVPVAPAIGGPTVATTVNAASIMVTGTAQANSLVKVYRDVNNSGVLDSGDTVVAQQQLAGGATSFSVATPLTRNAANDFVVTATDTAGESVPADVVPTITEDSTAPPAPTVSSPAAATTVSAATFPVTGTAEAGSLVTVYSDANNNGIIDGADAIVGQQQLTARGTFFSIAVPLTANAPNNFTVTAADAVGNQSIATVPTITQNTPTPTPTPGLTGNALYVNNAFLDILGRNADQIGLAVFTGRLNGGASRAQVAADILNSAEGRAKTVQGFYQRFLGRTGSAAEVQSFVTALNKGVSLDKVIETFVGSQEYFAKNGGTNLGFLQQAFRDLLGREIDASGQANFLGDLTTGGKSRADVVKTILGTTEGSQAIVGRLYQLILGRPADAGGRNGYAAHLLRELTDNDDDTRGIEDVIIALVSSPENAAQNAAQNA